MIRTYKYRLRPSVRFVRDAERWLGFCQTLYNAALQERIGAWKMERKSDAYPVSKSKREPYYYRSSGMMFLGYFNVDYTVTRSFLAVWSQDRLEIDLNAPPTKRRLRRWQQIVPTLQTTASP